VCPPPCKPLHAKKRDTLHTNNCPHLSAVATMVLALEHGEVFVAHLALGHIRIGLPHARQREPRPVELLPERRAPRLGPLVKHPQPLDPAAAAAAAQNSSKKPLSRYRSLGSWGLRASRGVVCFESTHRAAGDAATTTKDLVGLRMVKAVSCIATLSTPSAFSVTRKVSRGKEWCMA